MPVQTEPAAPPPPLRRPDGYLDRDEPMPPAQIERRRKFFQSGVLEELERFPRRDRRAMDAPHAQSKRHAVPAKAAPFARGTVAADLETTGSDRPSVAEVEKGLDQQLADYMAHGPESGSTPMPQGEPEPAGKSSRPA